MTEKPNFAENSGLFLMVKFSYLILLFIAMLVCSCNVSGQNWTFAKEKDGIKIYTKMEPGNSIKSFKGVADIHASMDNVKNLIGNVKNVDWWDKNVKEINVLYFEKEKRSQYYLVYDSPWPVTDRDLCVEALISNDPVTGVRTIISKPLPNVVPLRKDRIRIKDYWQKWTIEPTSPGVVHIILEGHVDPGGSVPDWIYNMVITDTPLKVMRGIKERLEK